MTPVLLGIFTLFVGIGISLNNQENHPKWKRDSRFMVGFGIALIIFGVLSEGLDGLF